MTGAPNNLKKGGYRLGTEIERTMDLRKFLEERILDNKMELSLREVLGIAKEFHESIVDLVKRKRLSTVAEPKKPVEAHRGHAAKRRGGGEPLFEAALGQSDHGDPREDQRFSGAGHGIGGPRF